MSKSGQIRSEDIRAVYRLIGDCRDLGGDPVLWYGRALEGLARLVGANAATGGEGRWRRPGGSALVVSAFNVGLDANARARYAEFSRSNRVDSDPNMKALSSIPGALVVRRRRELVNDREWYRSTFFNEYFRRCDLDHPMYSVRWSPGDDAVSVFGVHRAVGERNFSDRERETVQLFHAELGHLIGKSLVSALDPDPLQLAPRLRQTLACLLEGDSEKQVAARLKIRYATAHQYTSSLYRRFGVRSRAELLAYFLRRLRSRLRAEAYNGFSDDR